jgi:hypothetical protein
MIKLDMANHASLFGRNFGDEGKQGLWPWHQVGVNIFFENNAFNMLRVI